MLFASITATLLAAIPTFVSALGSTCSSQVVGNAGAGTPYWLQNIKHQGTSAFNGNPSGYQVFRNVKNFGAVGDGVTDDTAAINSAISSGGRCGQGCASSTLSPAVVYFPPGTYKVSTPIIADYYTELVGDARTPPTLLATSNFNGIAVIDADPYLAGGASQYVNQDNFYRSVRNFVIDLRQVPASQSATGFHWQVSQSTSLYNIVVQMSTASGNNHQGIFMENGSGGFMGDLVFNGGKYGIWVGNQQFTVRNVTVNNAQIGVFALWNWGWTFQGLTINNCQIGFEITEGGTTSSTQTAGAEAIIDATVSNTPVFVKTTISTTGSLAGSIVLDNINLNNVPVAVQDNNGKTVLNGGTTTIRQWAQGNTYTGTNANPTWVQANTNPGAKPGSLLAGGKIFGRGRPTYSNFASSQIVSVKDLGAKGDGHTDDTATLQNIFNQYAGCQLIYFDAGTYIVTDTLTIPPGTQMVGEAWTQIMLSGAKFQNINSPHVGVRVGAAGSSGIAEISGFVFTTQGPAPGAIVIEWNMGQSSQGSVGIWDSVIRLGSAAGTNMGSPQCPTSTTPSNTNCYAAFMALHLTSGSSAYLEGLWAWLGDHDLDDNNNQVNVFSGRGIYSQSQGPVWMVGTSSEHHAQYQYSLVGAKNHYMGLIQTETPYYQPSPAPPSPYPYSSTYNDPSFSANSPAAWGLNVQSSSGILLYGAGLYSFFQNYNQNCLTPNNCQVQVANIDSTSDIQVYSLSTVGTTYQLSVNGNGVINQASNANGFASTVTLWHH